VILSACKYTDPNIEYENFKPDPKEWEFFSPEENLSSRRESFPRRPSPAGPALGQAQSGFLL